MVPWQHVQTGPSFTPILLFGTCTGSGCQCPAHFIKKGNESNLNFSWRAESPCCSPQGWSLPEPSSATFTIGRRAAPWATVWTLISWWYHGDDLHHAPTWSHGIGDAMSPPVCPCWQGSILIQRPRVFQWHHSSLELTAYRALLRGISALLPFWFPQPVLAPKILEFLLWIIPVNGISHNLSLNPWTSLLH